MSFTDVYAYLSISPLFLSGLVSLSLSLSLLWRLKNVSIMQIPFQLINSLTPINCMLKCI